MIRRLALASGASLALAGCVNFAPDHARPTLSTEPAYDPDYRPDGGVVASSLAWQDYFADPRLDALIAEALANNRDLLAATARIEQAQAQYRIQNAQRLPTIGVNGSAIRSRVGSSGAATTGVGTGVVPGTGTGTGDGTGRDPADGADGDDGTGTGTGTVTAGSGGATFNRFSVGVGVSAFELDFWGRVANLTEAARAQYLATVAAQRAFYLSLIGDTASVYYQLVETQEQLALARRTVESRQEGLRIARLRLDAGVTSALDFYQAETLLTQAEQQVSVQQLSAANLTNQLTVLVGGRLPADLPPGLDLADQTVTTALDAGLPSRLLLVRPDIVQAEELLRADEANIGAARAAFFPTISLTGTAGFASSSLGGLFSGDGFTWSIGPSLSLPIFDWGARDADLGLARALRLESVANYDRTVQNAFREVSDALAGRRYIAEQAAVLRRAVDAQERIAHLARLRYREGVANYLEVLDAERNLFTARQTLLTAERQELQNFAALYVALGGGAEVPIAPVSLEPLRQEIGDQ
ncbi:efflux transporter outer membrane subunit [Novosphingopyxis sp.]|uniref:efflux transporter outer membrane subunit n=1 Tax=Novosphingopyxis sp. TaxID=2709690 RepID=UPI003B59728F